LLNFFSDFFKIFRNFQKVFRNFQKFFQIFKKKIQQKMAYVTPLISMSCGMPIFAEFFFKIFQNSKKNK
jgi:hypothetical protein